MDGPAGKSSGRGRSVAIAFLVIVALAALALTAAGVAGLRYWTDGATLRVPARQAVVRQVVWTPPQPLEGFSSPEQVYEPSISPDGTELYFVRGKAGGSARIFVSLRHDGAWTAPQPVTAVNGPYDSLGPRLTPDGRLLLFYSNRPGGFGGYDIWASRRGLKGWEKPFNLGPQVNSEFNEFNPDPTPDGRHLIFATNRKTARREQNEAWRSTIRETVSADYDLWIADARPGMPMFGSAREIPGVNTPYSEGASCMSPAGDFLYFASNRPGGLGKFDIYRCRVFGDSFGTVENVGAPINSAENEADPSLAYNGFRMIFSSDRQGADGRYHLLASDSREVYPEYRLPAMPQLGWSWKILLISLIVLIPLLLMLRGWDERRFSTIQKCLLLSLLVHALITFVLSFVVVTRKVVLFARQKEPPMEITVSAGASQAADETLAVRSQISGDVSASEPPPAPVSAPMRVSREDAPLATELPSMRIGAVGATMRIQAPSADRPAAPRGPAVTASADIDRNIALPLPTAAKLAAPEANPQLGAVSAGGKMAASDRPNSNPGAAADLPAPARVATAAGSSHAPSVNAPRFEPSASASATGPEIHPAVSTSDPVVIGAMPAGVKSAAAEPAASASVASVPGPLGAAASERNGSPALTDVRLTRAPIQAPTTQPVGSLAAAAFRPGRVATDVRGPAPIASAAPGATALNLSWRPESGAAQKVSQNEPSRGVSEIAGSSKPHASSDLPETGGPPTAAIANVPVPASAAIANGSKLPISGPRLDPRQIASGSRADPPAATASVTGSTAFSPPTLKTIASAGPAASAGRTEGTGEALSGGVGTSRLADPEAGAAGTSSNGSVGFAPVSAKIASAADSIRSMPEPDVGPAAQTAAATIHPDVSVAGISVAPVLGAGPTAADLSIFRAPERRAELLKQLGGTRESEEAVDHALAYLARVQESDGRWTRIDREGRRRRREIGRHDTACTGLALLAFLGRDQTPDRDGPYQAVVSAAVEYLIAQQDDDGDLRGPERFRGGGADNANMYDQGIAVYALAECAAMTHDARTVAAALKGAQFIVAAQNAESGGWRYSPEEYGDSSVFGWQVMALHSAERVGFHIPADTIAGAKRYIRSCAEGRSGMLAGYQPHTGATASMTAELMFSRMLLDMPLDEDGTEEVTRYLASQAPDEHQADLYYWYYASLSMLHMNNPMWKQWNVLTRQSLIHLQERDGPDDGSWPTDLRWGDRAGRVFTTALATLTLEVYYRYLPLRARTAAIDSTAPSDHPDSN